MYGGGDAYGDAGASQFAGGGFMPSNQGPAFGGNTGGGVMGGFSPSAGGAKVRKLTGSAFRLLVAFSACFVTSGRATSRSSGPQLGSYALWLCGYSFTCSIQ